MIIPQEQSKIEFFRSLFEDAKNKRDDITERFNKDKAQYDGRWADLIPGTDYKSSRNITYELIEAQISTAIPQPFVTPQNYSERNQRKAKMIERYGANIRDRLPFEMLNDVDERNTYIYGSSLWYVEWDEGVRTQKTRGDLSIHVINPSQFVPQPGITTIDEMDYLFLIFHTTKEDLIRKYGISREDAEATGTVEATEDEDVCDEVVCYYRNEDGNISRYIYSDEVELSDIDDFYARKIQKCEKCGLFEGDCECEKPKWVEMSEEYEYLTEPIMLDDGTVIPAETPKLDADGNPIEVKTEQTQSVGGIPALSDGPEHKMEKTKIRWYKPKSFPVVLRKNVSSDDSVFGQSDAETVRTQQMEINEVYNRIAEKAQCAGVYPVKPDGCRFEYDSSVNAKVLKLGKENTKSDFGIIDLSVDLSRDITYAEHIYDAAKRILGISDSYLGQYDASAKSGKAKQIQINQAAGRLDSKRAMKGAAYADVDRICFEMILTFADEPRPVTLETVDGSASKHLSRYDFVTYDADKNEWYYDDEYMFSVDASSVIKQDQQTLWEQARTDYQGGLYGTVGTPDALVMLWQALEKANYPNADKMVEHFRQQQQMMAQMPTVPTMVNAGGADDEQV